MAVPRASAVCDFGILGGCSGRESKGVEVDVFVEQLAALCREQVARNKWVFVPSHALGHTLGERIALAGTNWLNLRFVTPLDVALRMGAPFLVERGIEPSEEGLGPALIMRLMLDLPKEGGYFRPLADQPTLAEALWSTIRELRMAGIKSDQLRADAFESPAKHAELRALLGSYEQFLVSNNRGDMALVYEEALKHSDWCPIQGKDSWTELPDLVWSPLERRLLDAMPGERIEPRAFNIPAASVPRRMTSARVSRISPDHSISPLAYLLAPEASRGPRPFDDAQGRPEHAERRTANREERSESASDRVALFHAGGREAEIEEVFRRILAAGAPLDQVEIACASDAHVSLIWEKALRHEWPVTLGPGISAARTRPGRALLELCDWVETDFAAAHLRHLLQSGDMGIEIDDEGFTAGQAARLLARAQAGWGRATYGLALGRLRKSYESRANDPDLSDDDRDYARGRADLTGKVQVWITALIDSIPQPDATGLIPLQAVVEAALHYAKKSTARHSQLDHRAAALLIDHIDDLRALGTFRCTPGEALRFIRERVQGLQVAQERQRPGHLYVCTLSQAGYTGRPHLYVVGLEEGRVFPVAAEDPVLLDCERAVTSPDLRLSRDRIDESVYAVLTRLAAWDAAGPVDPKIEPANRTPANPRPLVTFSYSCRDTREFRETYASWLMLQAFRLRRCDGSLTYQRMKAALGEPVSALPGDRAAAMSHGAWWLRTVVGSAGSGVAAVESTYRGLARGREAERLRDSVEFTEFDGHVPEAGAVLDPCAAHNSFSVTDLEVAAACPFRFFLKRGLGLRTVDERERDKDIWLDALTRGSELHDLYARLLRRCRQANRAVDVNQDAAWLTQAAEARLRELRDEMPPATLEIFERESREFLADIELFVRGEHDGVTNRGIGFEVSFGRPLDADNAEPLASTEPIAIQLGEGLTFRVAGRIDRINRVGDAFEILDYKTGRFWRDDWNGVFNGGRRLQHALYGLAAVELLRAHYKNPRIESSLYYFPSHKGRLEQVPIAAPSIADTRKVLTDLRQVIVDGTYTHTPDEDDCRFCDYQTACGDKVHDQAGAKLEDKKLIAYGRLAAHV
jgi:ATP-dependent helicase/nuclease subunit B